ncbi:MAG: ribbon-helix-helix protein, CopG family [Solirubrobacteraceae bacterium]
MSTRTQTLVQLNEELVDLLDRRASAEGVSRSALVRQLLSQALQEDRSRELSRRMVEGYRAVPQETGGDAWGDLDVWTQTNARRNLAALADEEDQSW